MNRQAAGCESKLRARIHALSFYDIKCPSFVGQRHVFFLNKETSLRTEEGCQCISLPGNKESCAGHREASLRRYHLS